MEKTAENNEEYLFETACTAARTSGAILRNHFGKKKKISFKGRINPVTEVDMESEKTIMEIIKSRYPEHDIITEETHIDLTGSPYRWIIDPLDGTVNYAHDFPFVAVSIALEIDKIIKIGVVYNPIQENFFYARRGHGAYLNDSPIKVSDIDNMEKSLLATGFPYDIKENPYNNIPHFTHIAKIAQAIRRPGSAALDMCYTAAGNFDGYWEIVISPWDIAAGVLLVEEAGGKVTNLRGGPLSIYDNQVLATNGKIHDRLVAEIKKVDREVFGKE